MVTQLRAIAKSSQLQADFQNNQVMLHTHSKIWIHLVWTTKNREPIISKQIAESLYEHLLDYSSRNLKMNIERLNVQPDHIHALIDLPTNIQLADYVQKLKGESSHWLNKIIFKGGKFAWQRGFGAFSVSASQLQIVKGYVEEQATHHRKLTFMEEYAKWKKEYGIFSK